MSSKTPNHDGFLKIKDWLDCWDRREISEIKKILIDHPSWLNRNLAKNNQEKLNPLDKAILMQDKELIRWLMDRGAVLAASNTDSPGSSELWKACSRWTRKKEYECYIDCLIEKGVSKELAHIKPVLFFIGSGIRWSAADERLAMKLIQAGLDIEERDRGDTVLKRACFCTPVEWVKLLIQVGADVNKAGILGDTPLMQWIRRADVKEEDQIDVIRKLIEKGARLTDRDFQGFSALCFAVNSLKEACVHELLKQGVDVKSTDANGDSLLKRLLVSERSLLDFNQKERAAWEKLMKELTVDHQLSWFQKNINGESLFMRAVSESMNTVVQMILKLEPETWAAEKQGEGLMAVREAVSQNNIALVKWLLDEGVRAWDPVPSKPDIMFLAKGSEELLSLLTAKKEEDLLSPILDGVGVGKSSVSKGRVIRI